jgi:hypothetical protein
MGCGFGKGTLVAPPIPRERSSVSSRQRMNQSRAGAKAAIPSGNQKAGRPRHRVIVVR